MEEGREGGREGGREESLRGLIANNLLEDLAGIGFGV
jgi:hypothetical protein